MRRDIVNSITALISVLLILGFAVLIINSGYGEGPLGTDPVLSMILLLGAVGLAVFRRVSHRLVYRNGPHG